MPSAKATKNSGFLQNISFKEVLRFKKFGVIHVVIALALMQLFVALFTNGFAFSQEEAMWHYIGRNWFRNGLVPYTGGVDNKSPLFFVIFGLSDKLFGVNYWFPRLFGTICQSVGAYCLYKIANHIAGKRAGLLTISFYGLSVLWHGADGRYVSFTETYDVLFVIIAFYFFISARSTKNLFIGGFMAVIGLGFRLSALFAILALFIASWHKGRGFAVMFCLGLLAGVCFLALLCVASGINLRDVFTYMLLDNFGPGSITNNGFIVRMVQFYNMFFYSEVILFYPLVLAYLFLKRRIDWLLLWAILAFAGINAIGNYARVDLKDLLPALSLIGGLVTAHLADKYNISMKQLMLIVWICFSPRLTEPFLNLWTLPEGWIQKPDWFGHEPYIQPDENASKQLGLWVKANTNPKEKVFVAGYGSQVQAYSERISPTIYFNVTQTTIAKARFYKDMKREKPEMILVPMFSEYIKYVDADLRIYVDELVAKEYIFERSLFNYKVYRRKISFRDKSAAKFLK